MDIGYINELIAEVNDTNEISDGYHTFGELYEHRCKLFIALLKTRYDAWKSKKHHDESTMQGWFICGCGEANETQITYHLPIELWDDCTAIELDKGEEWDGHTSNDVLERLLKL